MKKVLITGLFLLNTLIIHAQKKFEGVVVYDMSLDNATGLPPEAAGMFKGSTITTYIKGDKRRVDTKMPMSSQSAIIDEKANSVINLIDVMGQKYLLRMSPEEAKQYQNQSSVDVKYVDGNKKIAGYDCKKAEITIKDKDGNQEKMYVYYTDEIVDSSIRPTYKGLKGFPMEYSINQNGMKLTITAKSVNKESVPDSKFDIPKDYKETTLEEMQKGMMQMGK